MRLLLDTHALIWWWTDNARLPPPARHAIADPANTVLVSAATAWEIATKHRIGKWDAAGPILRDLPGALRRSGFAELAVSIAHATLAGGLPGAHRDPFDRMLIAQSRLEDAPIVTGDGVFLEYGAAVLWA